MNIEGKIFNIDKELDRLYRRRNKLAAGIRQKSQSHRICIEYSKITDKIREQLKLRRECQNKISGKRLRDWLRSEHPEVYEKFFGSEEKRRI